MARYTGPLAKIAKRFGEDIFGSFGEEVKKKSFPGQNIKRRSKPSGYKLQLMEKQKAKYTYGLLEKQFRNTFKKASAKEGITSTVLLQLLEARLDNTVYRLGMASTRRAARQLVSHKHITVNGKIVNIPSYTLKESDIISLSNKAFKNENIKKQADISKSKFPWLEWDNDEKKGKFLNMPDRKEIPEKIKESLITELYSK